LPAVFDSKSSSRLPASEGANMQKPCDLYLCQPATCDALWAVTLYDKGFKCESGRRYSGYLGANIRRVKMMVVVSNLRKHNVESFSAPIEYRERENLDSERAFALAKLHASKTGATISSKAPLRASPPVVWSFELVYEDPGAQRAGAILMLDRLDGHAWSTDEYEEYMYDYNNIF
jgi:hypothetical protein